MSQNPDIPDISTLVDQVLSNKNNWLPSALMISEQPPKVQGEILEALKQIAENPQDRRIDIFDVSIIEEYLKNPKELEDALKETQETLTDQQTKQQMMNIIGGKTRDD
ncbi:MAG: hypothetical protein ACK5O1_04430 [Holosporales bacterium]|jgi:hypothetical protein